MHQLDDYFVSWRQEGKELVEQIFGRDFTVEQWDDYALAINYVCACLFKDVIEYCRAHKWQKTGVLWWSLIDMWPQGFNYSVVDYDFHKKPPYYWIRQSQQDFCLMIVRDEEGGSPPSTPRTRPCGAIAGPIQCPSFCPAAISGSSHPAIMTKSRMSTACFSACRTRTRARYG